MTRPGRNAQIDGQRRFPSESQGPYRLGPGGSQGDDQSMDDGESHVPPPPNPLVPHSDHGDPECCGLLIIEEQGDCTAILCNECGVTIYTGSPGEAQERLAGMASTEICTETCHTAERSTSSKASPECKPSL